jgi:RNA polymerase sigma-70 factor (ECF subfamily)
LCGLPTGDIARVLLVKETAVAARITRAKQKIAAAGVPFRLPTDSELPNRLDTVLTVIHLTYTAGHTASGDLLTSADVSRRAIGLARLLSKQLPGQPEVQGLLALLLLTEARREARTGVDGELVLLADQDRSRWDQRSISEGLALVTEALEGGDGRFVLQAAIAGLHAVAQSWDDTDWSQLGRMYDALAVRWPNPVVSLNRVAAHSLSPGRDLAGVLSELDELTTDPVLEAYPYLPATRADVLARLGRKSEALSAYSAAIDAAVNETERRFLQQRRAALLDEPGRAGWPDEAGGGQRQRA